MDQGNGSVSGSGRPSGGTLAPRQPLPTRILTQSPTVKACKARGRRSRKPLLTSPWKSASRPSAGQARGIFLLSFHVGFQHHLWDAGGLWWMQQKGAATGKGIFPVCWYRGEMFPRPGPWQFLLDFCSSLCFTALELSGIGACLVCCLFIARVCIEAHIDPALPQSHLT